jgi:IMP dehydrogenase family protein
MRDLVEIGMGRTARRTYELSDINIVPSRRTRSSQDVSTAWQLDAYRFEIPVIAHPTDALVSVEFAIELGRLGGLGVLNGEGLIGRHADVEDQIVRVIEAADEHDDPSVCIRLLQELHAAPLNPELLAAAVSRIRDAGVTTAVRVSPQNARALTPALVAAGIDLLVIQGTIISAERVASDDEPLNLKTFISELDVPVVAGGVLDHRTALHLMRTGAAGVIVGYGSTADAYRITDTHPEGRGASACIRMALADAGIGADAIDYINAHGTSTDVNDKVETLAIKTVFGERAYKIPVSSTKSMMGHLIAAAGATELIVCLLAIRDGILPPTINYENPDPNCDLDYVPNVARVARCDRALSNSFGFGGQNISLVVGRYTG